MTEYAVVNKPLEWFVANPENYRGHPAEQVAVLRDSLRTFGVFKNVVARPDGTVLAGHGLIEAALAEGLKSLPVQIFEGTDAEARALMVADNELSRRGLVQDDPDKLSQLLESLRADGMMQVTGYDDESLAALLEEVAAQGVPTGFVPPEDEGPGEPPEEPVTRLGDVWVMGAHRLVCGDSTQEHVWQQLGGERARRVAFWSPPYALGKSIRLRGNTALANAGAAYLSGSDSADGWRDMIDGMVSMAYAFCEVSVMNVQPLAGNKRQLVQWLADVSDRLCDIVTWDKQAAQPPAAQGVLASRYEWLVVLGQGEATRAVPLSSWRGTLQSVYCAPPQRDNEFAAIHGATFPVHLPLYVMQDLCDECVSVVDCCMGTGTTLIAAEQANRVGYGIELEPRYCDVAVTRWQRMTGKQAVLEATGETFDQLKAQQGS